MLDAKPVYPLSKGAHTPPPSCPLAPLLSISSSDSTGLYKPIALLCMPVTPSPPQPAHLPQQQADVGEEQGGAAPGPHRAAALLHKILLRGSQAVAVAPPKPGE